MFSFIVPLRCSGSENLAGHCRFSMDVDGLAVSGRKSKYVRILLLLIFFWLLVLLKASAGEPIRLIVIPYKAGWGSQRIPVNQFSGPALPPTPPPLATQQAERAKPSSEKIDTTDGNMDNDDWLMDG